MNVLEINVQSLRNNIKIIKEYVGDVKICFPVKANAYGHGLELIIKYSYDLIDFFAVSNIFEAFKILKFVKKPIIIFGVFEYIYINKILNNNIRISIQNYYDINKLEKIAKHYNKKIFIHVNVNTGMNCMGVNYIDFYKTIYKAYKSNWLVLEGVYSHLACADNINNPINIKQIYKFNNISKFSKSLYKDIICHLFNSYGLLGQKKNYYDMIRPGILVYGFLPKFYINKTFKKIKPIARLISKVVKIIVLQDGDGVGYSLTYNGFNGEKIAIIPIGYGDGFPRKLSNKGFVNINNIIYPIVGQISMDSLTVSLGINKYNVKIYDIVEVISNIQYKKNSIYSIANKINTIEYDIISTINNRIIRKAIY